MKEPTFVKYPKWFNPNYEESSAIDSLNDNYPRTTMHENKDMGNFREIHGDVAVYDEGAIPLEDYQKEEKQNALYLVKEDVKQNC